MANRKRKEYQEYLNEHQKNSTGQYEYTGAYYGFGGNEHERKRAYVKLWLMLSATAALVIASGCISGAGVTNTFYVILPYIAEVCTLFFFVWYSVKLLAKGDKIKQFIFKDAHSKIPAAAMMLAFFAIAGLLCASFYIITNGWDGGAVRCIIYLVLKLLTAAAALIFRNYFTKLEWIEI